MADSALIISGTAPVPVDNGKRVVLHGFVDYLVERLGAENVHYAVVDEPGVARPDFPGVAHRLDRPGRVSQLFTLARRFPTDRSYTVQEAMFGTAGMRDQIRHLVEWLRPDIEVYDTLRLGQHAPETPRGRRRVLYLDDLFSVRYDRMLAVAAKGDVDINPLGEFAPNVPGPLRTLIQNPFVYRQVLRMERDRIKVREAEVVHGFDVSLLVNSDEVTRLKRLSGSDRVGVVNGLLPAIDVASRRQVTPPEIVFLGRLNIPHNDDAICSFIREAMPELVRRHPDITLRIIGKSPSDALRALVAGHPDNVVLEGFVDDLTDVFARATVSLAPLRFGSGVKIKLLEALARGVPTVATTVSVEGIAVAGAGADGCFVEDDLTRWPAIIDRLIDTDRNAAASEAASAFFARTYGRDVVMAQYDEIFGLSPAVVPVPAPERALDDRIGTTGTPQLDTAALTTGPIPTIPPATALSG